MNIVSCDKIEETSPYRLPPNPQFVEYLHDESTDTTPTLQPGELQSLIRQMIRLEETSPEAWERFKRKFRNRYPDPGDDPEDPGVTANLV